MNKYIYPSERVAVVAMSCLMPDAVNTGMLWENILNKKVSIKDIPDQILNKSVFYRPEVKGKTNKSDKTYTQISAIVDEFDFLALGRKYRIPPAVAAYLDNNQKATIYCVDQAIEQIKSSLPKEKTAVILSSGAPGAKFENVVRRTFFANVESYILNHPEVKNGNASQINRILEDVSKEILKDTQPITEDTATGYLQNITAGRIANIFDFQGPSYVIDAACASSLTAISTSISGLLNHEYDAVISGGAEVTLSEVGLVAFSGINALSPDSSYSFDSRANGFVMGLGGGIVVLKRLSDALRDGDHIYSVISGYACGSDGKGKFIAAPSEEGQVRVIQDACKMAGYSVDTIEMIEAHGTGTVVGDTVEVSSLKRAFSAMGAKKEKNCGLGSIKSNIGHLRNAAGVAGFIKATLALQNKTLPASANIQEINPKLQLDGSPFYVLSDNKKWIENPLHPRRVNVSAYGFGGANCHICLEEFRPEFVPKSYSLSNIQKAKNSEKGIMSMKVKEEAVLFSAPSIEDLQKAYDSLINNADASYFEKAVYENNLAVSCNNEWRIAITASTLEQLKEKWQLLNEYINGDKLKEAHSLTLKGIYFGRCQKVEPSKIAFMFPGQGSQYPNMLKELYETYPLVKSFYMQADALWRAKYNYSLLPLIFNEDEKQKEVLKDTKNTHPAMFVSNIGAYELLCEAGIKADYMIGHSLGEITSLYASGIVDLKCAINIIGERGFSFDSINEKERGSMVSVKEKAEDLANIIKDNGFKVSIANINSSEQTVVGGESQEVARFIQFLTEKGYKHTLLNVSHAFHTGIVSKAAETFYESIKGTTFNNPKCKVMACHLSDFYSESLNTSQELEKLLKDQMLSPVRFKASVLKLYEEGVRVFIEAGPSEVLTNLVKNILSDKDVKVININSRSKSSVEGFNKAIAELFTYGVDVASVPSNNILGLYNGETINIVDNADAEGVNSETYTFEAEAIQKPSQSQAEVFQNSISIVQDSMMPKEIAEIKTNQENAQAKESIVYSGVSVGLPGTFKKAFDDNNFDYLFEGRNFIEMLTDEEAQSIMDLNITRLIKTEKEAIYKQISSINEVIHFIGKFGKIDMVNDYHIDENVLNQMTQTVCAGVAAGYEALKDAGIPLVREYKKTATGSILPGRFVLPKEMQDDTGIIFANGLYPVEVVISEVSKYTAAKFSSRTRKDIIKFYEEVISKISDYDSKKILSDWFTMYYSRLAGNPSESDIYEFNHNFLTLLSSQANNRLAQFIGATGPNMFLSTNCSSTTTAVTVAEDLIRAGHARRMIVIGADIASGKNLLPWFGAAFSSIGSLTDSDSLFDAAVPFDNRRKGMIVGSGAVGLIIEKEADVAQRGMNGICRILGSHLFNAGGHQFRIDTDKHCAELEKFMSKMEYEHKFDRNAITSKMVYCSHETYSHKQGGCSNMEKAALENTFGDKFTEIKVINTKGMTGHTMGASLEEAVSAKALQYQRIPPVVNYKEPDPNLEGLNLSKGGEYEFEFVLRTVSAMGGNGNYHLLQRLAKGDERIINKKVYRAWIDSISSKDAELKNYGRILVVESKAIDGVSTTSIANSFTNALASANTNTTANTTANTKANTNPTTNTYSNANIYADEIAAHMDTNTSTIIAYNDTYTNKSNDTNTKTYNAGFVPFSIEAITEEVLEVYSDITKYPKEMLELSMEIEADLGIDTVKQATIFSILADKFNLELSNGDGLSNYPTIGHIVELIMERVRRANLYPIDEVQSSNKIEESQTRIVTSVHEGQSSIKSVDNTIGEFGLRLKEDNNISHLVLELISQITKYPVEMLEEDMELEADLGIDTIKQATIISELSERFTLDSQADLKLSELKTIKSIIEVIESKVSKDAHCKANDDIGDITNNVGEVGDITEGADSLGDNAYDVGNVVNSVGDIIKEADENVDDNFEMELCVQCPVIVEEKIGCKDFDLNEKNIIIIGDDSSTIRTVKEYFKNKLSNVCEVLFEEGKGSEELEIQIDGLKDKIITTDVILDCSHLGNSYDFSQVDYEKEKEILYLNSSSRFLFYKKLAELRTNPKLRILCAVAMDGCFGLVEQQNSIVDPYYGALCGFYKGLRKEFGKSKVKVIDLGTSKELELNEVVFTRLTEELEEEFNSYEIGYTNNKRVTIKLDNVERSKMIPVESYDSSHFVITGGGNGITAEILKGISKKIKAKFTIFGRTELPNNIDELSKLDEKALEQIRNNMYDKYKNEGKKTSPNEIQREFSKITKAISVYKLLQEINKNGSDAQYFSCDVTDYQGLKSKLENATATYGPTNIIIHGAGIEKSRLIGQKTKEEFGEVFEAKANGLCNIYRLANNKDLKVIIGFSSISGRFGNEAQLDYCSANSFISSFMSMIKSCNKDLRAVSISWSGWKDIGMAWRNEFVKENSEEMGLHLIEPERGTNEFLNILLSNLNLNEVVISKGLSPFTGFEKWHGIKNSTPLIDWISKKDGDINKIYKVLSVKTDPIINNHRLGKTPLMPAVGFMEIGAQAHSLIYGKKEQYRFNDLKLINPLKLFNEKPQEIVMTLNKVSSNESIDVAFYNYFIPKVGKGKLAPLNSMKVSGNIGEYGYLSDLKKLDANNMIEIKLKDSLDATSKKLSNAINLGPLFMDEKAAKINKCRYNNEGAILTVALSEEQLINKKYDLDNLLINPVFADHLMQVCGLYSSIDTEGIYLPWAVGEFGIVKVARKPGLFNAYAKKLRSDEKEKAYDVILYSDDGEVYYYAKNVIVKRISQ